MAKYAINLIFIVLLFNTNELYSFFGSNFNAAGGIVTTNILGDNRAKMPIGPTAVEGDAFVGGSFKYAQPGIHLRGTFFAKENPNLRFTTSLDFMFFSGRERYGWPPNVVIFYTHELNITSFSAGAEYVWANLDFANAKLYCGADLQGFSVNNVTATEHIKYLDGHRPDDKYEFGKDNAFRFGGSVKLGVEGRLRDRFYVNTGVRVGAVNLLGRDDERGELLTPLKMFETKENILPVMQVYILIQYNM